MAVHDDPVVGYRFRPDIEQLLVHYLRPKLEGQAFPQGPVHYCDLYGDQEPWQIWESFKESLEKDQERKDLYFITPHKKKTLKGSRISRTVGSGSWKGDDASKKVLAAFRRVIGTRKRFHYENKGSAKTPGGCHNPCTVFKTNQYCCSSGSCGPTNLSKFFKDRCRDAYSYPKGDPTSTFTCPGGTNYRVVFCP